VELRAQIVDLPLGFVGVRRDELFEVREAASLLRREVAENDAAQFPLELVGVLRLVAEFFEVVLGEKTMTIERLVLGEIAYLGDCAAGHVVVEPTGEGFAVSPRDGCREVARFVVFPVPEFVLGEEPILLGWRVRVAGECDDVREGAFAHSLVANDGDQIVIQHDSVVEPPFGEGGVRGWADGELVDEASGVVFDPLFFFGNLSEVDPFVGCLAYLTETLEGRVRLYPGEAVAESIFVRCITKVVCVASVEQSSIHALLDEFVARGFAGLGCASSGEDKVDALDDVAFFRAALLPAHVVPLVEADRGEVFVSECRVVSKFLFELFDGEGEVVKSCFERSDVGCA